MARGAAVSHGSNARFWKLVCQRATVTSRRPPRWAGLLYKQWRLEGKYIMMVTNFQGFKVIIHCLLRVSPSAFIYLFACRLIPVYLSSP